MRITQPLDDKAWRESVWSLLNELVETAIELQEQNAIQAQIISDLRLRLERIELELPDTQPLN